MTNTNDGLEQNHESQDDRLLKPHYSSGGHATCVNSKCRARIVKSNATMGLEQRLHKALLFTNRTKIFIVEGAVVAECVCGNKYDMGGVFFEKNIK